MRFAYFYCVMSFAFDLLRALLRNRDIAGLFLRVL